MTAIMNRPDGAKILPTKHARPSLRQLLGRAARSTRQPWSWGIDLLGAVALIAALIGEVADQAGVEISPTWHQVLATAILTALAIYGMRVFTRDIP